MYLFPFAYALLRCQTLHLRGRLIVSFGMVTPVLDIFNEKKGRQFH